MISMSKSGMVDNTTLAVGVAVLVIAINFKALRSGMRPQDTRQASMKTCSCQDLLRRPPNYTRARQSTSDVTR